MTVHFRALIIDDEPLARQRLRQLLTPYPEVEVVGEAGNGKEGAQLVAALQPDLLFLDIEMPVLNGFDMLKQLGQQPRVVFVTAYDQYALKAFDENSVDYLLKPLEAERLAKTIGKLKQAVGSGPTPLDIQQLLRMIAPEKKTLSTLTVKMGDRIILLRIAEIIAAEAEDKYVFIYTVDGKRYLTDYTLAHLEEQLPDDFLRIHRSRLVNTGRIAELRRGFNGAYTFVMDAVGSPTFKSSRSHASTIQGRLGL